MLFALLALEGVDLRQLQILQAIAANAEEFLQCAAPRYANYTEIECYEFDPVVVGKAIEKATIEFTTFIENEREKNNDIESTMHAWQSRYTAEVKRVKVQLIQEVRRLWPCKGVQASSIRTNSVFLDMQQACERINQCLRSWYNNRKLRLFTQQVDEIFINKLHPLSSIVFSAQAEWKFCAVVRQPFPKYFIDFDVKMGSNYAPHANDIATARSIYENGDAEEQFLEASWNLFRKISTPASDKYLVEAQLYPRLLSTTILPRLLRLRNDEPTKSVEQQYLIGALAVVTCGQQRELRIARYRQQPQMEVALQRELDNPLYKNWRPCEHPEWLLFQIEMDLTIRIMQVSESISILRFRFSNLRRRKLSIPFSFRSKLRSE